MILIGDVHGKFYNLTHELQYTPRGSNYIQVGDFGLGFLADEYDHRVLESLDYIMAERDSHMFIIRGNHDNPEYWRRDYDYERVHLVRDNELLEIEGKKVFFLGGGISIDRMDRREGHSYWTDEIVDPDLVRIEELDHVDIVITHIAPRGVWPYEFNDIVNHYILRESRINRDLKYDLDLERDLMGLVKERLLTKGVTHWFYGHYHRSHSEVIDGVEYRCIDIMEYHEHKTKD